jgi:hypothetical protein
MELKELTDLIKIKEYVANSVGIMAIDRKTVSVLNGILLLLDKKIIEILTSDEFKAYIEYENVQAAKVAAVKITNIYTDDVIERKKKTKFNDNY